MLSALANNPDSNRRRRYFIKYSPQNVESGKNRRNQVGQGCGGTGALMCVLVAQLCLTLDPMDSPPGSPVNRILQARIPEVGCHALLQGIFPTQGSNPGLLHCRQILYHLSHQGSPVSFYNRRKLLLPARVCKVRDSLNKHWEEGRCKPASFHYIPVFCTNHIGHFLLSGKSPTTFFLISSCWGLFPRSSY